MMTQKTLGSFPDKRETNAPVISSKWYSIISDIQRWLTLILVLGCFYFHFGLAAVPSLSMYPTLKIGTTFLFRQATAEKITYDDIVVFFPDLKSSEPVRNGFEAIYYQQIKKETVYVKRVIGLAGDTLEVKDGYVYRNGKKLTPDYVKEPMNDTMPPYTVPDGYIFCMGDNRNDSCDSRVLGPFPENVFFGKLVKII